MEDQTTDTTHRQTRLFKEVDLDWSKLIGMIRVNGVSMYFDHDYVYVEFRIIAHQSFSGRSLCLFLTEMGNSLERAL